MASHAEKELQEFDGDEESGDPRYNFLWLQYNPLPLYEPFNFAFLGAFAKNSEKRPIASSFLFVRLSAWNNSAPTGRIFMKFDI
jgi:hypothetical protein